MKGDAEGIPMLTTHIAAQNIQCAGKDGVIAGNLTPETAQGVFCYMLVGDSSISIANKSKSDLLSIGCPKRFSTDCLSDNNSGKSVFTAIT